MRTGRDMCQLMMKGERRKGRNNRNVSLQGRGVAGGFANCYNYRNKAQILYNQ